MVMEYVSLTEKIINAAMEVHRKIGRGFSEPIYRKAMAIELTNRGLKVKESHPVTLYYKEIKVGEFQIDLLINEAILVNIKMVSSLEEKHFQEVRTCLKGLEKRYGLIFNFNRKLLEIKRVVNMDNGY